MTTEERSEYYKRWRAKYYASELNKRKLERQQKEYYAKNREEILERKKEQYKDKKNE
jgi:hypothetical protein